MELIKKYLKKHTDKITFMEIKNENIPLPILTDTLVSEITEGNIEEEIKMENIIEGIIFLMGIDPFFKYAREYKEILLLQNEKIEEYIFYKGIKFIEENDFENGLIYFSALRWINPKNINGLFNYALCIEEIAKKYFAEEKEEKGMEFIEASTKELEAILDMDDKYPFVYYKLGYHYKFYGQYLKAKLIWTKHLGLDKDEIRLQEIRGELELIENDVALETGLTYLSREYYDKALDSFLKLSPRMNRWWELKYLIGICYKGLLEYENAVKYLEEALELYKLDGELYNELGICLFTTGDFKKAIDVFSEGIENILEDYKLIFNRGLCYFQLGELKQAYKDIEYAESLNPYDENIKIQKEELEKIMLRGGV